jgi:hypothetical protein
MRRRRRKTDTGNPLQKAQGLIDLALDVGTTEDERCSAAMKAVKIIDKYDLLVRPFEGHETVQAAVDMIDKLTDPSIVDGLKAIGAKIAQARRR